MNSPIHLLRLSQQVSPEELRSRFPDEMVFACDFYVSGAELGEPVLGGYLLEGIMNVDHHAPRERMMRFVSSTNLALEYLKEKGSPRDGVVVVNHVDCDSILSAALLAGRLEPDAEFGVAAIAADHTGEENKIADLLQAMDVAQSRAEQRGVSERSFELSFRNLCAFLEGGRIDAFAEEALAQRLLRREKAERLKADGVFQRIDDVEFAVTDEAIDGEFFPALLPDAAILMVASPYPGHPGKWQMKLRRGLAAHSGFSFSKIGVTEFDPCYEGRWNAGSNRRGGGTSLSPESYARELALRYRTWLSGDRTEKR